MGEIEGDVFEGAEVGVRVVGTQKAFVVAKDHVHHPTQAILDGPMSSHDGAEALGWQGQRGDVEPRFSLGLVRDFAAIFDHDDTVQLWPGVALPELGDIVDDGSGLRPDTAMIALDRLMASDFGFLDARRLLLGHEHVGIVAQRLPGCP